MLCKDCKYLKGYNRGWISTKFFCGKAKDDGYNGTGLGVHPWFKSPHPKCPLNMEKEK